jgi:cytochrome P450
VEEFKSYLRRLIAERRRRPSQDPGEILSALIAAEDAGDRLTEVELLHQCIFLLNAGHETRRTSSPTPWLR